MKSRLIAITLFVLSALAFSAKAQDVALKSNLFYDATTTANLGLEFGLSPKWTFDFSGNLNAWRFSGGKQWRHWLVQPEARYWLCNTFAGHFFATHLLGGQYNFGRLNMDFKFLGSDFSKLNDMRYQGWFVGAGVGYGYAWILNCHWNLEAEIGIGWAYTRYDTYRCAGCGKKVEQGKHHNYFGPTKAAINLVYVF